MVETKEFGQTGQQGDVLLDKLSGDIPESKRPFKTEGECKFGEPGVVLRMGEVTDHGHVVRGIDPGTVIKFVSRDPETWRASKEEFVIVEGGRAALEHVNVKTRAPAEHGSLILQPGRYKITTVQEFNYDSGRMTNVLD